MFAVSKNYVRESGIQVGNLLLLFFLVSMLLAGDFLQSYLKAGLLPEQLSTLCGSLSETNQSELLLLGSPAPSACSEA